MSNITIKSLLAADEVSDLIEKINFNFNQLLINGGGPIGLKGGFGDDGPVGPRGAVWFTINDLYTTPISPTWTGTPQQVNIITNPGYPQFQGDPNKYLPVAKNISPWTSPQNTYLFGNGSKVLRGNDLLLQQGDDNFNGHVSKDGDIWEYSLISNSWNVTGVNIKGDTGNTGATAIDQWSRISQGLDDVVYPSQVSGQNIPKIFVGDDINILNEVNIAAAATFVSPAGAQLALGNPLLHNGINAGLMPSFTVMPSGNLVIQGSQTTLGAGITNEVYLISNQNLYIQGQYASSNPLQYFMLSNGGTPVHQLNNGGLIVINPSTNTNNIFTETTFGNTFKINLDVTNNQVHLNSLNGTPNPINATNIVMQDFGAGKVGIGFFGNTQPANRLTVSGNASIGYAYINTSAPSDGLIVAGLVGIGTSTFKPSQFSGLEVGSSVDIGANGYYGFNAYWNGTWKSFNGSYAAYMKQEPSGTWHLDISKNSPAADATLTTTSISVTNTTGYIGLNNSGANTPLELVINVSGPLAGGKDNGLRISPLIDRTKGLNLYHYYVPGSFVGVGQPSLGDKVVLENRSPWPTTSTIPSIEFTLNSGTITPLALYADGTSSFGTGNIGVGTYSFIKVRNKIEVQGNIGLNPFGLASQNPFYGFNTYYSASYKRAASGFFSSLIQQITNSPTSGSLVISVDGNSTLVNNHIFVPKVAISIDNITAKVTIPNDLEVDGKIISPGITPIGGIIMYSGAWVGNFDSSGLGLAGTELAGWAICNGNSFTTPSLIVISTPNLRGQFIVGLDERTLSGVGGADTDYDNFGKIGGSKTHTLTKNELPTHKHDLSPAIVQDGADKGSAPARTHLMLAHNTGNTGHEGPFGPSPFNSGFNGLSEDGSTDGVGNQPHENRPPYFTLAYIMRIY